MEIIRVYLYEMHSNEAKQKIYNYYFKTTCKNYIKKF